MMGRQELKEDPRFLPGARGEQADEIDTILIEWLQDKTQREVFEEGIAWRIPIGVVNNMETLFHDPQHRDRNFFVVVDHPELGKVEYPGHLFIMSETPWQYQSRAPLLGEHNREILMKRLGYSEKDLEQMSNEDTI
jgi:crotonobetainyl-CoA:carnitine CoA-transferase CaiB-like acyl-CoA transferase